MFEARIARDRVLQRPAVRVSPPKKRNSTIRPARESITRNSFRALARAVCSTFASSVTAIQVSLATRPRSAPHLASRWTIGRHQIIGGRHTYFRQKSRIFGQSIPACRTEFGLLTHALIGTSRPPGVRLRRLVRSTGGQGEQGSTSATRHHDTIPWQPRQATARRGLFFGLDSRPRTIKGISHADRQAWSRHRRRIQHRR